MNEMTITDAQYYAPDGVNVSIFATVNGERMCVPIYPGNTEYDEITRQVEAGDLTIQDAD
jgi:hypothetical protein